MRPTVSLLAAATIAMLAACGDEGRTGSQTATATPETVDCAEGANAVGGSQTSMRQLTDSLNALAPASERNDVTAVFEALDAARQAADQVGAGLGAAASTMTNGSLVRTEFQNAAAAGTSLRDALGELRTTLSTGGGQQDRTARLQTAITTFETAMTRLTLACSNRFSAATVEPTVTPTRTTR